AMKEQLSKTLAEPSGYHAYFHSAEKKGYSGTAIFTKKKPMNVSNIIGVEEFDREGRVINAEFDDFFLFNVYFPNGRAKPERLVYKLEFYDEFLKVIEKARKSKPVIFCGDLNTAHKPIDLAHPKENEINSGFLPIEREWIDKVIQHGYTDTLRQFDDSPENYSWWDYKTRARERNVGWRLDYFFVSQELLPRLNNAFIMPEIMGSDHCPVGIEMD
ncbi:MAG: exodeoxyribonuclease III, partial [Thermoplasmata archaeon]|nr:exodeoxyribonuclease III [Thermoplasmata archaeon]